MTHQTSGRAVLTREVLVGSGLMVLGLVLLIDPVVEINLWASGWTIALFVIGLARVVDPSMTNGERPSRRVGVWLMTVGAWGFVSLNELFGLSFRTSWPILLTAAGAMTVWWAVDESRRTPSSRKAD